MRLSTLAPFLGRRFGAGDANHAIPGHETGELGFVQAIRSVRPFGDDQETKVGRTIVHSDLYVFRKRHTELTQHSARLADCAAAICTRFVPVRRQTNQ